MGAEYPFPCEKSRSSTGMPLGFASMTGGARYPPRPNPHYSGRLLLQPPPCRCDKPGHTLHKARRAGSPLSLSTYCFKYASLLRGFTRPSREASQRFRYEPSRILRVLPGRKAGIDQDIRVARPWPGEFQKVSTRRRPSGSLREVWERSTKASHSLGEVLSYEFWILSCLAQY